MEPKPTPEPTPPPQSLPVISEETRTRLIEELGLDIDLRTQRIVKGISGEPMSNPYDLANSLATNVFSDLISVNRNFVQIIDEELTKVQPFHDATHGRTVGMAVVLRAFEVDSGFNLLSRFRNLQAEDLNLVRKIVHETLSPAQSAEIPILKKLLTMPRIPEQQVALNEVVQKADTQGSLIRGYLLEGAATMYQILSHLWSKLSPHQSPTPEPPQMPPTSL